MEVVYWRDTDTAYITFRGDLKSYESEEIAPGVVADFTESGDLVGIEVYDAALEKLGLSLLATEGIPIEARPIPSEAKARRHT